MMYDLTKLKKTGVYWVRHLPIYTAILNDDHKRELGWKTPFEVYFGRKKNTASCISKTKNPRTELIQRNSLLYLTEIDVSDFEHTRKDIRSTASNTPFTLRPVSSRFS